MIYKILKLITSIGIRFYYKEVKILNKKELLVQTKEPLIIIANHPNTLMDAMLIGFVSKQPIHFMAKGTLFNSKFKLWLLKKFNMIPINRQGEGKIAGVSNQQSFDACYKVLEEGKTLVIFPEGTSFLERHLRELKSGTARIALEAEKRNHGKLNLTVLPIGLNYLQAEKFRSSVIVNVGKRIHVSEYLDAYNLETGKAARKLTEKFRISLENLLVNSDSKEHENMVDQIADILSSRYMMYKKSGVEGELLFLKTVRDRVNELELIQPWILKEVKELTNDIEQKLNEFGLKSDFLDRRFRSNMFFRQLLFSIVFIILGFPVFLIGLMFNIIQFKLTDVIVPKISKDIEYYAPLALLLGLIMYPIVYFTFYEISVDFFPFNSLQKIIYFFLMPLSGIFSYSYYRYCIHVFNKWNYVSLMLKNRKIMNEIQEKRMKLRECILG